MKRMMFVLPALILAGLFACKPAMMRKYAIKDPARQPGQCRRQAHPAGPRPSGASLFP